MGELHASTNRLVVMARGKIVGGRGKVNAEKCMERRIGGLPDGVILLRRPHCFELLLLSGKFKQLFLHSQERKK